MDTADFLKTTLVVGSWMAANMAVLLLNKLLLTYYHFKYPILLTLLHMAVCAALTWGLHCVRALRIKPIQSRAQLTKVAILSGVFATSMLLANVSLRHLAVSMNQALGSMTPVFAALFAYLLQGRAERPLTYATLGVVVGGIVIASGVEPNLHLLGALACLSSAAGRGLRAVMQAMLLSPEEKLDSMSCLAYMSPLAAAGLVVIWPIVEPASMAVLPRILDMGGMLVLLLALNCLSAFACNYLNMVVTQRTSALTIQVLGQFKGVASAGVSVLCFRNTVTPLGWFGYSITVMGCLAYGRCKAACPPAFRRPGASLVAENGAAAGIAEHLHSLLPVQYKPGSQPPSKRVSESSDMFQIKPATHVVQIQVRAAGSPTSQREDSPARITTLPRLPSRDLLTKGSVYAEDRGGVPVPINSHHRTRMGGVPSPRKGARRHEEEV